MIFVLAKNEPALFVMLNEQDVKTMRDGRTVFVDQRQLKGGSFDRVILSLHRTNEAALEMIRRAGHPVPQLKNPEPVPGEQRCKGCNGLVATVLMYEGRCIVCWATECQRRRQQGN